MPVMPPINLKKWVDEKWLVPDFLTVAPNDARIPVYAGKALEKVQIMTAAQVYSLRPNVFNPSGIALPCMSAIWMHCAARYPISNKGSAVFRASSGSAGWRGFC